MSAITSDYAGVLYSGTPLIDLRSPSEFERGAFPNAVNLPLLTDDERKQVGICYKQSGRQAAIDLGNTLVSGETKAERLAGWLAFAEAAFAESKRGAALYCWRGGLRSETVQDWVAAAGCSLPRIDGGYKALRQFCIASLIEPQDWIVLAGRAGSGKTRILNRIPRSIDLEALANHRGSAFGKNKTAQPKPIDFENALAIERLKLSQPQTGDHAPIALEDESRTIGRLAIPERIFEAMQQAPVALVEVERQTRIESIYHEYVGADAREDTRAALVQALDNIQRRLGGERHRAVRAQLHEAFESREQADHHAWIGMLLDWYYDPMYDYQVAQKEDRIAFRGDGDAVTRFLLTATE